MLMCEKFIREKTHLVILLLIVGLSSCSYPGIETRKNLMSLKLGMTKDEVINIIGLPERNEAYKTTNSEELELFFYYTGNSSSVSGIANCSWGACTPLLFEDGKLTGWGREIYEKKTKIELDIKHDLEINQK